MLITNCRSQTSNSRTGATLSIRHLLSPSRLSPWLPPTQISLQSPTNRPMPGLKTTLGSLLKTLGSLLKTLGTRPQTISGATRLRFQMLSLLQFGSLLPLTKCPIPLLSGLMSNQINNPFTNRSSALLLLLMTQAAL